MISKKFTKVQKSVIRKIYDSAHKDAINLGLGEIQFDVSQKIKDFAKKVIDEERVRYTPNAGLIELRNEISKYYDDEISAENICVTNGAEEGLFSVLTAITDFGDEILISDPTFIAYESIINMVGGKAVKFDLNRDDNFNIDFSDLNKKISVKTKAILINNPLNPTGRKLSEREFEKIIKFAKLNNLILISDEIYRELVFGSIPKSFLNEYDNAIVISGLSKSHLMTGWRLGWAASQNKDLMKAITTAHQYIATCAPFVSQKIASFVVNQNDEVEKLKEILRENKDYVINFLIQNNIEFITPDFAPYIFIKLNLDDYDFCKYSAKHKLIIIPGSGFGKNSKNYVRLSYGLEKTKLMLGLELFLENRKNYLARENIII